MPDISLTKNEIHFLLYSLKKVKGVYENEGKYGSANVIESYIKTITEQTEVR